VREKISDNGFRTVKDEAMQQELIKNISPLGITQADEKVAEEILKLI
jgi:hypothetical protein